MDTEERKETIKIHFHITPQIVWNKKSLKNIENNAKKDETDGGNKRKFRGNKRIQMKNNKIKRKIKPILAF